MENTVSRKEHTVDITVLHRRVDEIRESSIRMEESSKRIEAFGDKVHKVMYGNGQAGIITKVSNLFTLVKIHFWLLGIIVTGVLGVAFWIIRRGV